MTNICREMGKRLEEKLYREWGGKPTTQILRHRDGSIDSVTKRRYHAFLAAKINAAFPDTKQEKNDPAKADEAYQSGARWLLDHTRRRKEIRFTLQGQHHLRISPQRTGRQTARDTRRHQLPAVSTCRTACSIRRGRTNRRLVCIRKIISSGNRLARGIGCDASRLGVLFYKDELAHLRSFICRDTLRTCDTL